MTMISKVAFLDFILPNPLLLIIGGYLDDIPTLIQELNDLVEDQKPILCNWFVCEECNELIFDQQAEYLSTSKWGSERPFCSDCYEICTCDQSPYAPSMSYMHEDCEKPRISEDDLDVEEENSTEDEA